MAARRRCACCATEVIPLDTMGAEPLGPLCPRCATFARKVVEHLGQSLLEGLDRLGPPAAAPVKPSRHLRVVRPCGRA
jgi:hypothetical protein